MIHFHDLGKMALPDHWRIRQVQAYNLGSFRPGYYYAAYGDTSYRIHLDLHRCWVEPQLATFQVFVDDVLSTAKVEQTAELILNFNYDGEISERELEAEFDRQVRSKFNPEKIPVPEVRKVSGVVRLWRLWRHREGELYALARSSKWELNSQGFVSCDEEPKLSAPEIFASPGGAYQNPFYTLARMLAPGSGAGFHGFYEISEMMCQESDMCNMAMSGGLSPATYISTHIDGSQTHYAQPQYSYIMGSYLAWGKMVRGSKGMRASHAKPEYLILPTSPDYAIEMMTLADKYGMKPVTMDDARRLPTGVLEGKTWRD